MFMQTLWKAAPGASDPNAGALPEKKALMQALTVGLLEQDAALKNNKAILQLRRTQTVGAKRQDA